MLALSQGFGVVSIYVPGVQLVAMVLDVRPPSAES